MKPVKVYDSVNFDYPQCGGYEVWETPDYYSIREYSNYQGRTTGKIVVTDKGGLPENKDEWDDTIIDHVLYSVDYDMYRGKARTVRKGCKVQ